VRTAAQRAAALTRQLLIFGRRGLVHGEVVDINHVLRESESLLRSAVGEHIDLRTKLGADLPHVRVDKSHIEQVLLNLTVNARDAMPDGGALVIETSERTFTDDPGDSSTPKPGRYICLSVSDTGSGFTDEARKHVFEPFFTTKPAGRGTGLGLATVHGIARDAGGAVTLYSEPGLGTAIRVYLPAVVGSGTGDARSEPPAQVDGAGRTVLLVEDEPQLRLITGRMLERHNYRVYAAESPGEALTLLDGDAAISLLVTDVVMPGTSGPRLAEQAQARHPGLRVLYMSGFPRDLWERGQIDRDLLLLEKPFDAEQLLHKVSQALTGEAPQS